MKLDSIVLGGGCFWCVDTVFRRVKGVESVTAGYAGGEQANPSYWDLHKPGNSHAEVIKVDFEPNTISLEKILKIFFAVHDPTTKDRQGNDKGPEYRSIILYSDHQKQTVEATMSEAQELWDDPIVTEVKELDEFYPAEDEHQDYFNKNPSQAYCQIIINPKLQKFQKEFKELLKD